VPISHLGSIKDEIEKAHSLGLEKQSALWVQLKALFAESNGGEDVRAVLGMLRRRVDLFATIAEEIDVLLQPTPPARVPSQRRARRHKEGSKLPAVSPNPSATRQSSQLPEWRAELISKKTLARTLRVHLTRDTHVIELAIKTTFPAKAVVTLRGESLVESSIPFTSSLATGAHAMRFALPDGDERREAKVDTVFSIWSGRIKRLQLSVDGKRLYDDERAAGN